MIDLSGAGLAGATAGIVVAAVNYYIFMGTLERAVRERLPSQTAEEQRAAIGNLSIIRRVVLAVDLLVFVALGYWLGRMVGE
jgi:hypothetical protein